MSNLGVGMGEERALDESGLGNLIAQMSSFRVGMLKYIHIDALCYNKCKPCRALGVASKARSLEGEKNA